MENCRDCKWCFEEDGGKKLGCLYSGLCHTPDGDKRGFERKNTDQPPFAGIGKLYFCRVEDVEKDPKEEYLSLDKPVSLLKPGMMTYKDDDKQPSYSPKGFSIGFDATMEEPSPELMEMLVTPPNRWDVQLERRPGRMPRKMKKAYCYGWLYRRDTRWKRKAGNYRRRLLLTLHDAEIVVTREQRDRLSDVLNIEMEIRRAKEVTAKKPE